MSLPATPATSTRLVGRTLGRYQILERIGGGGMASVYLAYDPAHNRKVALKLLPPVLAEIPQFSERFRREAQLVMQLKHPHIVPIEDMQEEGEFAYQVMPYYKAGSLAARVRQGPLRLEYAARLTFQTASALDYAHRQGVVHRDVKPSNILLDGRGDALLSDFGLALIRDTSVSLTGSALLGTPAYISPELAQSAKVDARSDQYSLGIILYELVTGRLPFEDDTPMAVVMKHINQPLPSPRRLNPDLPPSIEQVILRATAKQPADRFGSVDEMAQALQKATASSPEVWSMVPSPRADSEMDETPPEAAPAPGILRLRAARWIIGAVAALGIAAAVVLARGLWSPEAGSAEQPATQTILPTRTALPPAPTKRPTLALPTRLPAALETAGQPTLEPTPRRLDLPVTPTPLPAVPGEDPRAILDREQPTLFDYFDDPTRWLDSDRPGKAAYWFADGMLHGKDYEPDELRTWWSTTDRQSGNVYAEISTINGDCIDKDSVGIAVRVNPETTAGGYALEISCDGSWRFRRFVVGEDTVDLVAWTSSDSIETGAGAKNRLGIFAYLDRFIFFINNQQVGEATDLLYSYKYGTFALYVRASRTFDLTASFDDFAFWHIRYIP